jgi:hypothetical protein
MIMNGDVNSDIEVLDYHQELAALARLVTYARQSAQALNIEFPTYCLDLALAAVLEQLNGVNDSAAGRAMPAEDKRIGERH